MFGTNDNDYSSSYSLELQDKLLLAVVSIRTKTAKIIRQDLFSTLLASARKEIGEKVLDLEKQATGYPHSRPVIDLVLRKLQEFATGEEEELTPDVMKITYHLELVSRLERFNWENHQLGLFPPLDELLVYLNFNSKSYTTLLQQWLKKRVLRAESLNLKLHELNLIYTNFLQLHRKPDVQFNDEDPDVTTIMVQWFEHERQFIENEIKIFQLEHEHSVPGTGKIKWKLSSDQLAIFVRACFDCGIIEAKSMSAVYQFIIPHISTKHRDDLSPSAVRTSAYNPEQVDKDGLKSKLQSMMKWIDGY
ncbi:hypothetical protein [Pedobacter sp.]